LKILPVDFAQRVQPGGFERIAESDRQNIGFAACALRAMQLLAPFRRMFERQ